MIRKKTKAKTPSPYPHTMSSQALYHSFIPSSSTSCVVQEEWRLWSVNNNSSSLLLLPPHTFHMHQHGSFHRMQFFRVNLLLHGLSRGCSSCQEPAPPSCAPGSAGQSLLLHLEHLHSLSLLSPWCLQGYFSVL